MEKEIKIAIEQKFLLIRSVIEKHKLKNIIRYLCKLVGVSRSGYYNYFSVTSQEKRKLRDQQDELLKNMVLKAFHFKKRKKGARQIKMTLNK